MKRSLLMSALVLALAAPLAACGGGGTPDAKTEGTDAKPEEGGGDPIVQLQKISDDIMHDVDTILQPVKDADAILDDVSKLAKELKDAKSKTDWKKVLAEAQKITGGTEANIDGLGLDGDIKVKVTERFGKLKGLVEAVKNIEPATKDLGSKVAKALVDMPPLIVKAEAKAKAKLAVPFGVSADDKKAAQADIDKVEKIFNDFKAKAQQVQSDMTALVAKAKDLPKKFAALK